MGLLGLDKDSVRKQGAVLVDEDVVAAGHKDRGTVLTRQCAVDAGFTELLRVEEHAGEGKAVDGVGKNAAALRA